MVFADADFFLALLKRSDPLKASAEKCLADFRGQLWTSPSLHAALCILEGESIISSDAVYDRLGNHRIKLGY